MQYKGLTKATEMYLFCASRAEFVDKVVLPNISAGKMVITDRYVYSSLVYQGLLGGLGVDNVLEVNKMALQSTFPDLIICLKGAKSFRNGQENRFDEQTSKEADIIYNGFDEISKKFNNFVSINVDGLSEQDVFNIALKEIENKLNKANEKINNTNELMKN